MLTFTMITHTLILTVVEKQFQRQRASTAITENTRRSKTTVETWTFMNNTWVASLEVPRNIGVLSRTILVVLVVLLVPFVYYWLVLVVLILVTLFSLTPLTWVLSRTQSYSLFLTNNKSGGLQADLRFLLTTNQGPSALNNNSLVLRFLLTTNQRAFRPISSRATLATRVLKLHTVIMLSLLLLSLAVLSISLLVVLSEVVVVVVVVVGRSSSNSFVLSYIEH